MRVGVVASLLFIVIEREKDTEKKKRNQYLTYHQKVHGRHHDCLPVYWSIRQQIQIQARRGTRPLLLLHR
jgi:hypothetical protein